MAVADRFTVLHYVGYDDDRGGIVSVVRTLAATGRNECLLGVNPGFRQRREPALNTVELPRIDGEKLGVGTFWRARGVAWHVQQWLCAGPARVFHAHSRAGLAVALWLQHFGERRVVVSVHCYGRQRWFYRWAARRLGDQLFWLSPAMKRYYGVGDSTWVQCIPGSVASTDPIPRASRESGSQAVLMGGVGAIVPWKGWDLVLKALATMPPATRGRLRFAHIGATEDTPAGRGYAAALRAETTALGLDGQVEWRGEQSSSRAFLGEIDALVIASNHEPFSVAMLEAMAAGVPVLAANSGGAGDVIEPPRNGWLFRSGDVVDLARMMEMLAGNGAWTQNEPVIPDRTWRFSSAIVAESWTQVYARVSAGK